MRDDDILNSDGFEDIMATANARLVDSYREIFAAGLEKLLFGDGRRDETKVTGNG